LTSRAWAGSCSRRDLFGAVPSGIATLARTPRSPDLKISHKPFQNGAQSVERPLAVLHEWNRFDKHRVLPVMLVKATNIAMSVPEDFENYEVIDTQCAPDPKYVLPGMDSIQINGRRRKPARDHGLLIRVQVEAKIGHESGRTIEGVLDRGDTAVDKVRSEFERLP